ncbi:hypothetical protein PPROV_000944000 [Pycnococcus provasolii]|uniref:Brix domain-containing protein n=1 Tax=Pycnococcus provasolii TaxID=41880 RepID=A0A830I0Y1_9CHLO|nr:hypothetical protein PPROV_000944000 [Pycnococcus provasolii]|mmetsp:Transcript_5492/g.14277  ORF Transcript_5492/g.14277 Transcript_5492/m.14277 type:complete len:460 (-) Transcript_5492:26-1405(-)
MAKGSSLPSLSSDPSSPDYAGPSVGDITSKIKNRLKRSEVYHNLIRKNAAKKRKLRKQKKKLQKSEGSSSSSQSDGSQEDDDDDDSSSRPPKRPKKQMQKTIENTRIFDAHGAGVPRPVGGGGDGDGDDDALQQQQQYPGDATTAAAPISDEFDEFYSGAVEPRVLITTGYKPSKVTFAFVADLLKTLPSAYFYKRLAKPLTKVYKLAVEKGYTAVLVIGEDRKHITSMSVSNLPRGPTAVFRVSNVKLVKDIKGHGRATGHRPEVILNNFKTTMGQRMGRLLGSLFNNDPQFVGRRAVTFHNQRDFIFFRHHRYIFETKNNPSGDERVQKNVRARLQELGPRFTLRLDKVRKGPPGLAGEELEQFLREQASAGGESSAAGAGAEAGTETDAPDSEKGKEVEAAPPKRTRKHPTKLSEIRAMARNKPKRPLEYEEAMTRRALKAEAGQVQGVRRRKFVL